MAYPQPMETETSFESTNINSKWLGNIYENLKNLEAYERTAREGCGSLLEFLSIPSERWPTILGEAQYKNLNFMVTELNLLLTDLTPVVDKEDLEKFRDKLTMLDAILNKKSLFITHRYAINGSTITSTQATDYFYETLEMISQLKRQVIQNIAHLLYVKSGNKTGKPWD